MPIRTAIAKEGGASGGGAGSTLGSQLRIGPTNDGYEREADSVAERVMRMPQPTVQRKCAECENEEKKLQRKESNSHSALGTAPPIVGDVLSGNGRPLDSSVRSFMEPRFGHDFGNVRIHTDSRAAESAQSVNALAYTVGRNVVFGQGAYRPQTESGRRLIAHELTHVRQQAGGRPSVQREKQGGASPPAAPPIPSIVSWAARTSDATESDNCCAVCPVNLGVDIDSPNFKNGIEFKGTIRNHSAGFSYDIKRTKEANYWRRNGASATWSAITSWNKPAGSDDDSHNSDECLTPTAVGSNHKVYSEDRPGFRPDNLSNSYTDYVQMINFIESLRIIKPDGTTVDDPTVQNWHTKMWVQKSASNVWSVNTGGSEIATGHLAGLSP